MKTQNIKKSIVAGLTTAFAFATAFCVGTDNPTAAAFTPTETNGCYTLVATGTETQAGVTVAYANNSSDFTLEFDLLKSIDGGSFGFINGKKSELDLAADDFGGADYLLCGEDGVTSSSTAADIEFTAGYRYILEVKRSDGTARFSRKPYAVYETVATEKMGNWTLEASGANFFGLVVCADKGESAWALIDNWKLSSSSGSGYETFEKAPLSIYSKSSNENGYAQLFQGAYYNVVFMTESGGVIQKVRAQEYTALTCSAPEIEGKKHVGWSEDVRSIQKDMIVLPVYEDVPVLPDNSESSSTEGTDSTDSTQPPATSGGMQCGSSVDMYGAGGLLALMLGAFWLWNVRREER